MQAQSLYSIYYTQTCREKGMPCTAGVQGLGLEVYL